MEALSLEVVATLLGIISILAGGIAWYRGSVTRSYAAEREMGHIKRNLEQLSQGLGSINDELEGINRTLVKLEALILSRH